MNKLTTVMVFVASLLCFCPKAAAQTEECDSVPKRRGLFKRVGHSLYEFVKEFSRVDTAYIEPQHYNYTVMLQNTNTYEVYRLTLFRMALGFPWLHLGPQQPKCQQEEKRV